MQNRRETLKQSAVVAGLLATAGFPQFAYAAFNKAAFDAKSVQDSAKAAGATSIAESKDVTGRVFETSGRSFAVAEGWVRGPSHDPVDDPTRLGPIVEELLAKSRANSGMDGRPGSWPQPQKK